MNLMKVDTDYYNIWVCSKETQRAPTHDPQNDMITLHYEKNESDFWSSSIFTRKIIKVTTLGS